MKFFTRTMLFVILATALSFALTGVAAQEPVTLDLWIFEGEQEFLPTVIEAFQEEYPHISVQITDIPENEYITKIDTALLAGEPPDLGFIYERRWVTGGYFLPLDDVMAANNVNLDDYNEGALSNCQIDDHIYCLGTYAGAVLLFYNKDLFDAAGVPYPSATEPMSIDEYADIVEQLAVPSENIEERVWGTDIGTTYWWMNGLNYFSEDGRTALGYYNDEATIHTYDVIAQMYADGVALSPSESSLIQGVDLLSTGRVATSVTDNLVAIPQLEAAGVRWGAAVTPVESAGDPPWVPMWSDGLGVFSQSDNIEEAALFAVFMGTVGNELRLSISGALPLNMRLADEQNWAGENEGRQEAFAAIQQATAPTFIPNYFGVIDPINEAFYGLMLEEGMSAEEAFNETADFVQENLDEAWEVWDAVSSS